MDKLAFVALASVKEQAKVRASITNSMANSSTIGFKESFETATSAVKIDGPGFSRFQPGSFVVDVIKLQPVAILETGSGLHVPMYDSTVLGIQAADGTVGFIRRGDMTLAGDGLIEHMSG